MANMNSLTMNMWDSIEKIDRKEITPAEANAKANLAGKINATIKNQLEYARLFGVKPHIPFIQDEKDKIVEAVKKEIKKSKSK